ncbi:hypothetical protein ONE63_005468 [Megalurothrips usitatus]|uniref:Carboxylesterase type B domain-containing protein n=1 Tax=Megalurothrips usitatus TaxID=439358 RepID=A0AAV7Y0G2_9NEOP|nr:hypothetical protein ONE63_005468 [Megalurothrips usitatus]
MGKPELRPAPSPAPPPSPRRVASLPLLALAAAAASLAAPSAWAAAPPVFCELPGLGVLRGTSERGADNATFAAFQGVPYAQPPLGAGRFQPALPGGRFMFLDARSQRLPCPYINGRGLVIGSEDCLYLSVYTPQVDEDLALPVLVVLPGDDWTRGYAGRWQPHRLVGQGRGLVVVTVQSRLGALGFLSTGDAAAPGNLGLKDERLALEWVRKHIRAFGGDPQSVTVAGVGAGAAAAMLHALSSPGLLQRAIAVSGSALSPWSLADNTQQDVAAPVRRLAEAVGCDCRPVGANLNASAAANATATSAANAYTAANASGNANATIADGLNVTAVRYANLSEILECLRAKPVADIVYGTARLQGWAGLPPSPFGPVVERGAGGFLTETPRQLWARWAANSSVPILIGLARSEGLQTLGVPPSGGLLNSSALLGQLDADWARLAPPLLAFNTTAEAGRRAAAEQLRRRYLGAAAPAAARDGLLRLFADRHIVVPVLRAAALHAAKHPVYLYRFAWNAAQGAPPTAASGPAGGSDAQFLLMRPQPGEAVRYPAQSAMASDIVAVWASFIATGVPVVGNTTLPRVTSQNLASSELPYVELVQPGVQAQGNWSVGELFAFWDGLPLLENQKPPRYDYSPSRGPCRAVPPAVMPSGCRQPRPRR